MFVQEDSDSILLQLKLLYGFPPKKWTEIQSYRKDVVISQRHESFVHHKVFNQMHVSSMSTQYVLCFHLMHDSSMST